MKIQLSFAGITMPQQQSRNCMINWQLICGSVMAGEGLAKSASITLEGKT